MPDDPRWLEAMALMEVSNAAMERGDVTECIRSIDRYYKMLTRLVDDPNAAEDDRAGAMEILDEFIRIARTATPDALRALDRIVNDPYADGIRANAEKSLAGATEQISGWLG
jgi:hypothetical protein